MLSFLTVNVVYADCRSAECHLVKSRGAPRHDVNCISCEQALVKTIDILFFLKPFYDLLTHLPTR